MISFHILTFLKIFSKLYMERGRLSENDTLMPTTSIPKYNTFWQFKLNRQDVLY